MQKKNNTASPHQDNTPDTLTPDAVTPDPFAKPHGEPDFSLYSYWRSTTSYRVRIALNIKQQDYKTIAVNLLQNAQNQASYLDVNPLGAVPTLACQDGTKITQSLAIMDYLEALYPKPRLLSKDPLEAAHMRAAALTIACDIHPLNNLKVTQYLRTLGEDDATITQWMHHWMREGLNAYSALIAPNQKFSFGDAPCLADICLIPQLYNAHRWGLDLSSWPRLLEIEAHCLAEDAFHRAHPDQQDDAQGAKNQPHQTTPPSTPMTSPKGA